MSPLSTHFGLIPGPSNDLLMTHWEERSLTSTTTNDPQDYPDLFSPAQSRSMLSLFQRMNRISIPSGLHLRRDLSPNTSAKQIRPKLDLSRRL